MNQDMVKKQNNNSFVLAVAVFALIAFVMIAIGIGVLRVPAVAMCVLVIVEVGLAVMLHHAELWLHGVLVLAEIIAGIAASKFVPVLLCAVIYVAATVFLQILDKGESSDGR